LTLLEKQRQFVASKSRRRAFLGGFGCGKTSTGAALAIRLALCYPGSRGMIAGVSYVRHVKDVIVPKLKQELPSFIDIKPSDRCIDIIIKKGTKIDKQGTPITVEQDMISKILFYGIGRAGDEDAFRSEEFDWAWVDEAIQCDENAFKFIPTRLNRNRDNPHQLGLFYVTTTPDEPSHWLKKYLDDHNFDCTQMQTRHNTHLTEQYLGMMENNFTGAFASRYLRGEWVTVSNAMFDYSHLQYISSRELPKMMHYVAACDPATSKTGDYFVIVVLGKAEKDPRIFMVDMICQQGVPINDQIRHLKRVQDEWNPSRFVVETVAYQDALRQLVERDIPHIIGIKPEADKVIRAMQLSSLWQNGNFVISDRCIMMDTDRKKIENQFLAFPAGEHDDIVDASVYAYQQLCRTSFGTFPIMSKYTVDKKYF
jgi:predicted phage terminase large subunit-like protein